MSITKTLFKMTFNKKEIAICPPFFEQIKNDWCYFQCIITNMIVEVVFLHLSKLLCRILSFAQQITNLNLSSNGIYFCWLLENSTFQTILKSFDSFISKANSGLSFAKKTF